MTALFINDEVRAHIRAMIERAEAHPISIDTIVAGKIDDQGKSVIELTDRKPGFERPASEHLMIPAGFRVALSIEEQPAGWCKHLSISVPKPGKIPTHEAAAMIADEFGFQRIDMQWLEEFEPGHHAVNLIYVYKPAARHRA